MLGRKARILVLAGAGALALATWSLGTVAQEMPPVPVQYAESREKLLGRTIELPGTVEAREVSEIAAEVSGRLTELRVREGDEIRRGHVIARVRRKTIAFELEEARAALTEAEARHKLAQRRRERSQELYEAKIISDQELDDSITELSAWQARVSQSATRIERLEDQLARASIRAPFSGVVVKRHRDVGEWLDVGDPVVELMALDKLEVVVPVPEKYFDELRVGGKATVRLQGLQVEGSIRAIVPRSEEQARSFPVRIEIGNEERKIAVGMLAEVLLSASEQRATVIVPKDAIVGDHRQRAIFVVNDENTVRRIDVQVGQGIEQWVEVKGDVAPAEKVVIRGNERLFPGQAVVPELLEISQP